MKCLAYTQAGMPINFQHQKLLLPGGKIIDMKATSKMRGWLGRWRWLERLFRLEPRCAAFLGHDKLLVAYQRMLWVVDMDKAKILKKIAVREGFSDVLTFCQLEDGSVYYGDYGMNPQELPIHIYKIGEDLEPTLVYTFPAGSIRHIHNLVYDSWRKRFFVFTGDEGKQMGIYVANRDFTQVEAFLTGSQQYRAVIGHVTEQYLYYATDAVMEDNFLYRVTLGDKPKVERLGALNGSVIYGCDCEDGFMMSTTVEPYPSKKSRLLSLLDNRRGRGIKSAEVMVYHVSDDGKINLLECYQKDVWPMRLFQYGCVQFPAIERNAGITQLMVTPVAVRKVDGKPQSIRLAE